MIIFVVICLGLLVLGFVFAAIILVLRDRGW
jgi:hypothetical protein